MRPILLNGHERSITCVKFNTEGDLLFTAVGTCDSLLQMSSPLRSLTMLWRKLGFECAWRGVQSKDTFPTLWLAETGERMGTYNGHLGAVWDLDPSW